MNILNTLIPFLRQFKISIRLLVILLICTLIPSLVIFRIADFYCSNITNKYISDYIDLTDSEIESRINMIANSLGILSLDIIQNKEIPLIINGDYEFSHKQEKLDGVLSTLISDKVFISGISIITVNNEAYFYSCDKNFVLNDYHIINNADDTTSINYIETIKDANNNSHLTFGIQFRNFYTGYHLGTLLIYVNEQVLHDIYGKYVSDQHLIYVLDQNDIIISCSDTSKLGSTFIDIALVKNNTFEFEDKKYITTVRNMTKNIGFSFDGWKILHYASYDTLLDNTNMFTKYMTVIRNTFLLLALIFSLVISRRLTRSISVLQRKMVNIEKERSSPPVHLLKGNDELWELEKIFNDMIGQINSLIEKNNEEKEEKRKLEFKAMQAQINPHFIYNTLDAITWLAKINDKPEIVDLSIALSDFFRISLQNGENFITIKDELAHVKAYILIQQTRFQGKFTVEYDVDEDIMNYKMPKIILQPLVENAIIHGIAPSKNPGLIQIIGYRDGNNIRFEVIDNGVGFVVDNPDNKNNSINGRSGYGTKNIRQRLMLEYGDGYDLKFHSKPDIGTRVEVTIKIQEDKETSV